MLALATPVAAVAESSIAESFGTGVVMVLDAAASVTITVVSPDAGAFSISEVIGAFDVEHVESGVSVSELIWLIHV